MIYWTRQVSGPPPRPHCQPLDSPTPRRLLLFYTVLIDFLCLPLIHDFPLNTLFPLLHPLPLIYSTLLPSCIHGWRKGSAAFQRRRLLMSFARVQPGESATRA